MSLSVSFILIVGDDGALLIPPMGIRMKSSLFARGHGEGQATVIRDALKKYPRRPVLILADTLAQEYKRETLPPVGMLDKRKLLARRLKQQFPDAELSAALPLGKNSALLACLHDEGAIAFWRDNLVNLKNPSGHMALLPLESAGMVSRLVPAAAKGWAMLISWQRTGGFRQIVTYNGELILARLTSPLPITTSAPFVTATLALDIQASLDYLARHGLTDYQTMRLVAILPEHMHAAIAAARIPVGAVAAFTPHKAAKRLGLPFAPLPDDHAGDALHAAWLMRRNRPLATVMKSETRKIRQAAIVGKLRVAAAILALSLVMGITAWQVYAPPPTTPDLPVVLNNPLPPAPKPPEPETAKTEAVNPAPLTDAISLGAVMYAGINDWAVWLQNERWTPQTNRPNLHIIAVSPDEVKLSITATAGSAAKEITLRPHQTYDPVSGTIGESAD